MDSIERLEQALRMSEKMIYVSLVDPPLTHPIPLDERNPFYVMRPNDQFFQSFGIENRLDIPTDYFQRITANCKDAIPEHCELLALGLAFNDEDAYKTLYAMGHDYTDGQYMIMPLERAAYNNVIKTLPDGLIFFGL